jgi:uncharacterized protein (DUF305 family)
VVIDSPHARGARDAASPAAVSPDPDGPDGPDLPDEPDEPGDGDGPEDYDDVPGGRDRSAIRAVRIAVTVIAVPLVIAIAFLAGRVTATDSAPTDISADAGFARDMQVHHSQAVEMSLIVRDRTTDPEVRLLAYDILRTQQQQAGQMYAWLQLWKLPQASNRTPMAWAGDMHGMNMPSVPAGASGATAMPGMASAADIRRLSTLSGKDAERLYLQLMIAHHKGGVGMAQAAIRLAHRPEVLDLAHKIVAAQQSEITLMESMLAKRS